MNKEVVYFSKMYQAVPVLAPVMKHLGGTFVTNRNSTLKAFSKHYSNLEIVKYNKLLSVFNTGRKKLKNADLIVTGSPYGKFLSDYRAKKVMVFHGTYQFMSREALARLTHFDYFFLTGPRMSSMMGRHQGEFNFKCIETGFIPFEEYPYKSDENKQSLCKKLNLDPSKRMVLYTPSRQSVGSWDEYALDIAQTVPLDYNLVIRPHPSQVFTSKKSEIESFVKVKAVLDARRNAVLDLAMVTLPELLSVTDLIISDANSTSEEAMFYDVPQLFIETVKYSRETVAERCKQEGIDPEDADKNIGLFDCGPSYKKMGADSWGCAIEEALGTSEQFASRRDAHFEWVFGQKDRGAATRVSDFLKKSFL